MIRGLSSGLSNAFSKFFRNLTFDKDAIDQMIEDIEKVLESADIPVNQIQKMTKNLRTQLYDEEFQQYSQKQRIVKQWVYQELVHLLTPSTEEPPYEPIRGRPNVILFCGLQGSGKTTSIAKYALFYKKRKWKCAMVCADTFRAGAFDQLKQNATKVGVPFYGSYSETDPVALAKNGVDLFRESDYEVILVDTSGRHRQEESLFEEMEQIVNAVEPNHVVFVMDGTIGQAAQDHAQAFKNAVNIGSCVITKLDSDSKGGGAIAAVSATNSRIAFLGLGEHFSDFQQFSAERFAARLIGFGDPGRLLSQDMKELLDLDPKKQKRMIRRLEKGVFTPRDMHQFLNIQMKMGLGNMVQMLRGSQFSGQENKKMDEIKSMEPQFRKFITIMDSMTNQELDSPNFASFRKNRSRVRRLMLGSGCKEREVLELFKKYSEWKEVFSGKNRHIWKEMKKCRNNPSRMKQMFSRLMGRNMSSRNIQMMRQMEQIGGGKHRGVKFLRRR